MRPNVYQEILQDKYQFHSLIHGKYCSFQVHVLEQYQLYGFASFIADVGGFLGLLLGASLLSLFEACFESCKTYFSKKKDCSLIKIQNFQ